VDRRALLVLRPMGQNPDVRAVSAQVPTTTQAEQLSRGTEHRPGKTLPLFIPSPPSIPRAQSYSVGERINARCMWDISAPSSSKRLTDNQERVNLRKERKRERERERERGKE